MSTEMLPEKSNFMVWFSSLPARAADFIITVARLTRADLVKLLHYWVVVAGYASMVGIAALGAYLIYHAEQAIAIKSGSGYAFAISLVLRCVDFGAPILYVMICILFALEISNSTIKYILTRPVTRMELIISKYVTAMIMIIMAIGIFWVIALVTGWYFYGLGDLVENEYPIFTAGYMFKEMFIGTVFLLAPFAAIAAMALMVSSYSSTMGGAIIIGIIAWIFFQIVGLIPTSLGFTVSWYDLFKFSTLKIPFPPGLSVFAHFKLLMLAVPDFTVSHDWFFNGQLFPYLTLGFPSQRYVPMYMLDDLPTGIPISTWWSWDIQKMVFICGIYFIFFFLASLIGVKERDFTL